MVKYYEPAKVVTEKFFLVGITLPNKSFDMGEKTLEELERLSDTAGAEVVGKEHLRLREIHAGNFIGTGHAENLALLAEGLNATGIVFDEDLSPAQNRNLEDIFQKKVLDRSSLILDIFAQHAHSKEGKLQVELAQLEYLLPRLRGWGKALSRLGGGIGTRGPGETKLETDRRRIVNRISSLKREIKSLEKHRNTQRRKRIKEGIPTLSLVGYTNAGKSTLLNALTDANVLVEDKLFSTLDPTAKKLLLPGGKDAILIDTVGFIRKLPHTLIASFRATLEEIRYADILLLVVDASSNMSEDEIKASHETLEILDITHKPLLTILNKTDKAQDIQILKRLMDENKPSVAISAKTRDGMDHLLQEIEHLIGETRLLRIYRIPYHRYDLLSKLQSIGNEIGIQYLDQNIEVRIRLDIKDSEKLEHDPDLTEKSEG
ncbi:GTPase HflX [Candidatus Sumerlaeota bacterium]|nr:GTPase HflX [Candidatus Sumerlaeota bacterium]